MAPNRRIGGESSIENILLHDIEKQLQRLAEVIFAAGGGGGGTVTSVSVASANGFAGSVATATTTPAITISTSITGIIKGNGTAISAAIAGTDYLEPNGSGGTLTGVWRLASGGTLTGVNTITTNSPNNLLFTSTYTATANTQSQYVFGGIITHRTGGGTTTDSQYGLQINTPFIVTNSSQTSSSIFVTHVGSSGTGQRNALYGTHSATGTFSIRVENTGATGNAAYLISNDVGTAGLHFIGTSSSGFGGVRSLNLVNTINLGSVTLGTNSLVRLTVDVSGNYTFAQSSQSTTHTDLTITQAAHTGGTTTGVLFTGGALTAQTASAEATDINFNLARTVQFGTGALATQRAVRIQAPTYAFVAASTLTTASTLAISGAPIVGTNATITNSYALNVEAGVSNFGGNIRLTQTQTTEVVASDATVTITVNGTPVKFLIKL